VARIYGLDLKKSKEALILEDAVRRNFRIDNFCE
jgi:hypothetical protein